MARTLQTADLPVGGVLDLVEPGDDIVASVSLEQIPAETYVLDDGRVVAVDSWGSSGVAALVILIDSDGRVRRRVEPAEVLDRTLPMTPYHSTEGFYWRLGSWIDEPRDQLVLIERGPSAHVVDITTGVSRHADFADVLFAPSGPEAEDELITAWETARAASVPGVGDKARAAALDARLPLAVRVRAATMLDPEDLGIAADVLMVGFSSADAKALRWSRQQRGRVLGATACPDYRRALEAEGMSHPNISSDLCRGMAAIGDDAVDYVVDWLLDPTADARSQWQAAVVLSLIEYDFAATGARFLQSTPIATFGDEREVLRRMRGGARLDSMGTLLAMRKSHYQQNKDVHSCLALPALVQLQRLPRPESAASLVEFLQLLGERPHPIAGWNARLRSGTVRALQACTGLPIGDDPAAWRDAVPR